MNAIFAVIFIVFMGSLTLGKCEIILERCLPKADMENITINCSTNEIIAIREAFFTSSIFDQCKFIKNTIEADNDNNSLVADIKLHQISCTDDLRLTMNSRCSGHQLCMVNLRKIHNHQCSGYDGWINLKYSCVPRAKLNLYCNIKLSEQYGYVANPGYPKFYPPYDCKWKIEAYEGQRIQIEILDISIKEPRYLSNKKLLNNFECTDNLSIIDANIRRYQFCGETKTNLIEYRSKTAELLIEFQSYEFSPTRGVLFRYQLIDCPTLKPPVNGYMYRNLSLAYYNCYYDYVFEDTKQSTKVLSCQFDTYWNDTVTRCVAKEISTTTTTTELSMTNITDHQHQQSSISEQAYALSDGDLRFLKVDDENNSRNEPSIIYFIENFLTNPLTFIIIGSISIIIVIIIIILILRSNNRYGSTDITV